MPEERKYSRQQKNHFRALDTAQSAALVVFICAGAVILTDGLHPRTVSWGFFATMAAGIVGYGARVFFNDWSMSTMKIEERQEREETLQAELPEYHRKTKNAIIVYSILGMLGFVAFLTNPSTQDVFEHMKQEGNILPLTVRNFHVATIIEETDEFDGHAQRYVGIFNKFYGY